MILRLLVPILTFCFFATSCYTKKLDYSSIVNKDAESIIKTYEIEWLKDHKESQINDSLRVFLHSAKLDTFKYPDWYSPPSRLKFKLLNRENVSFKFSVVPDTISTNIIYDTLEVGSYFLTLDYTDLKSGIYSFHRQIGDSLRILKFILLFSDN